MEQLEKRIETVAERIYIFFKRKELPGEMAAMLFSLIAMRVTLLNELSPFGYAMLASVWMSNMNQYYALLGCVLGASAAAQPNWQGIIVCAVFILLCLCFRNLRKRLYKRDIFLILAASLGIGIMLFRTATLYSMLMGIAELIITLAMTTVFQRGLGLLKQIKRRKLVSDEETLSLCLMAGVLVLGLSGLKILDFSFGLILAIWLSMMIACFGGAATGTAAAVALGLMLSAGGDRQLIFAGTFAACALVGGTFKKMGKVGVVAGFALCNAIVAFYIKEEIYFLPFGDLAAAAMLVLVIPNKTMNFISGFFDASVRRKRRENLSITGLKEITSEKLRDVSEVFGEVGEMLAPEGAVNEIEVGNLQEWTAKISKAVCSNCRKMPLCWQDSSAACEALLNIVNEKDVNGRLIPVAPIDMACSRLDLHVRVISELLAQYTENVKIKKRLSESQSFVSNQLTSIGKVMHSLAESVEVGVSFDEELEASILQRLDQEGVNVCEVTALKSNSRIQVSIALRKGCDCSEIVKKCVSNAAKRPMRITKKSCRSDAKGACRIELEDAHAYDMLYGVAQTPRSGNQVSGDQAEVRELGDGRVLVALSDGMGSGRAAARDSSATVALLGKLFALGYSKNTALETVNRLLMIRGVEESYATIDAVMLDLIEGKGEFIKLGAPPSYVVREGRIATILAETLPAGIVEEAVPAVRSLKFKKGDIIVIMTDGVYDALGENTAEEVIKCAQMDQCEEAAAELLNAAKLLGAEDDLSVVVVKITGEKLLRSVKASNFS